MFSQRQPLDVVVQSAAQVMSHPLTHTRCQIFLEVGTESADNCDDRHRGDSEVQNCIVTMAEYLANRSTQTSWDFVRPLYIVDNNFDRPRLKDVGDRFTQHGHQREGEGFPVRTNQVSPPQLSR